MNHNPTVKAAELRKQLEVTTDPAEYDQLQAQIHEAEKAAHLKAAGVEVAKRERIQREREALEAQHQANLTRAQQLLDGFAKQEKAIEKTLAAAFDALLDRYETAQAYEQARIDARHTAERLGQAEPKLPPKQETTPGDLASAQAYAKDRIGQFADKHAEQVRLYQRARALKGE